MTDERTVHCPKCGELLRRISRLVEPYNSSMGILEYDMCCNQCDITVIIEDRSSFEQDGNIRITFN